MHSPPTPIQKLIAVLLVLTAVSASGQLTKLRDYQLHQREDRGVVFSAALTQDNTLITLVARNNGDWLLSRVGKWWEEDPQEQQIHIAAFSRRDHLDGPLQMKLLLTPDGQNLVVLISATMKVPQGDPYTNEMIISMVRLDPFRVIATAHSKMLGMKGYLDGFLDRHGRVIVDSSLPEKAENGSTIVQRTYYGFATSDLHIVSTCGYISQTNALPSKPTSTANHLEKNCSRFAAEGGFSSAVEMDKVGRSPADNLRPPFPTSNFGWSFLEEKHGIWLATSANSEDILVLNSTGNTIRRFEPESMCGRQAVRGPAWMCDCNLVGGTRAGAFIKCDTSHDNLFGWSVGLKQWIAEIDIEHERDLSKVDIPIRDTFDAKVVKIGSATFLLIVLNGSRLQVFSVGRSS